MDTYHLCDSEYRFMQVVWDTAPLSSGQLVAVCAEQLGWKKSTTYTVLKKMCEKGLLQNEHSFITVLAPQEAVTADAAESFVERTFGGSLPCFLTAFMSGRTLSEEEATELKQLIDRHKEG